MIRELKAIAAITDLSTDEDIEVKKLSPEASIADLQFRLQRANAKVAKLIRKLDDAERPDQGEVSAIVNRLETTLRGLSRKDVQIYLYTFNPQFFAAAKMHPELESEVKDALVRFCKDEGIPELYDTWSSRA